MDALSNYLDPVTFEKEHRLGAHARDNSEGAARSTVVVDGAGLAWTPAHQESLVARPSVQTVATVAAWIEVQPGAQGAEIEVNSEQA